MIAPEALARQGGAGKRTPHVEMKRGIAIDRAVAWIDVVGQAGGKLLNLLRGCR